MPHHMLSHIDCEPRNDTSPRYSSPPESVSSNAAACPSSKSVLITCRIMVHAPDGSTAEALGSDHYRITIAIADLPPLQNLTKRILESDIAKVLMCSAGFLQQLSR